MVFLMLVMGQSLISLIGFEVFVASGQLLWMHSFGLELYNYYECMFVNLHKTEFNEKMREFVWEQGCEYMEYDFCISNYRVRVYNSQLTTLLFNKSASMNLINQLPHKSYNLTEYRQFRTLELQFTKIKHQNAQLQHKLTQIQNLYQQSIQQATLQKKQLLKTIHQLKLKDGGNTQNQKSSSKILDQIVQQLLHYESTLYQNEQESEKSSKLSLVEENDLEVGESMESKLMWIERKMGEFVEGAVSDHQNFIVLARENEEREKLWLEKQNKRSQEIVQLQISLDSLSDFQKKLKLENQKIANENQELVTQLQTYKAMAIQARNNLMANKLSANQSIQSYKCSEKDKKLEQDTSFTLDLLSYEKQLLVRTFELIESSFHDEDIEVCLKKIFEAYEEVISSYRQKLQIEYDLQDLQCEYRKEQQKNTKKSNYEQNQGLISLKKEINRFRKELHSQKQDLYRKQNTLQEKIKDLSGQATYDHRLKSYTIDLQAKLRRQNDKKIVNSRVQNEQAPVSYQKQMSKKLSKVSFQFKQTMNTDQVLKDMIEKDRQNMEKVLKETRSRFQRKE